VATDRRSALAPPTGAPLCDNQATRIGPRVRSFSSGHVLRWGRRAQQNARTLVSGTLCVEQSHRLGPTNARAHLQRARSGPTRSRFARTRRRAPPSRHRSACTGAHSSPTTTLFVSQRRRIRPSHTLLLQKRRRIDPKRSRIPPKCPRAISRCGRFALTPGASPGITKNKGPA